jgi:alpha-L-rhamnosidase
LYQYTGDVEILRENYPMMKKYVDYMHSRSPDYIADFGLGDWIPVETVTPVGVTSTGYFFYGAKVMSEAAAILGNSDDGKKYSDLREKIRAAFNQKYFNSKSVTYANGSQTALSCALFHGLVPREHEKAVQQKLVAAVNARQGHIDAGILGARYLPHVLSDFGHAELSFKMITAKSYPGWGYWIEQGATTLWEDWKGEGSMNHIMLGDVSSWFYKTIAGIRPMPGVAGFREFIIKPQLISGITWANGKYESNYGTIVSNWKIEGGRLTHHLEIPVGTAALYHLPSASLSGVSESGKTIDKSSFSLVKNTKNGIVFRIESGIYEFTMPVR